MPGKFTLDSRHLEIKAPRDWTDEQAQALLDPIADALDKATGALGNLLLEIHPDLSLTSRD